MNTTGKFAVIADDYTGASDSGIHFSRSGKRVDLLLRRDLISKELYSRNNVALTTESRFMEPTEASKTVMEFMRQCQAAGFNCFFKKVDSAMRGNPGSEIESALQASGRLAAVICPAMPKTGRTCVDNIIYLNGAPLHTTGIANDPFHPITTSSIGELLRKQTSLPMGFISHQYIQEGGTTFSERLRKLIGEGRRLIVADATSDVHLLTLAKHIVSADLLPVGAGGLAEALAKTLRPEKENGNQPGGPCGPILAAIGSLAGASRRQAEIACESGLFKPFVINPQYSNEELEKACIRFIEQIDNNEQPNILLQIAATDQPARISIAKGAQVANLIGTAACLISRQYECGTVFATGGSTAMVVARALGIESVSLVDEIAPGVVLGCCNTSNTSVKWFVSKAGGFGDHQILKKMAERLLVK